MTTVDEVLGTAEPGSAGTGFGARRSLKRGRRAMERLLFGVASLLAAITIVFLISRLTGDPATLLSPPGADAGDVEAVRQELGLDRSLWSQYLDFITGVFSGDLGQSYYYREDVSSLVMANAWPTVTLALAAITFAMVVGVGAGLLAAFNAGQRTDGVLTTVTMLGQAVPSFWLAPMLILVVAVWGGLLPATGQSGAASYILPAVSLGMLQLAIFFRITRAVSIESLNQDFIRVARSKGVGSWRLAVSHVMPTTALPLLTVAGIGLASLIGGAVIVESIFSWPGLGNLMIKAVLQRDFPVVQGIALVFAMAFIVINTIVDLLYTVVDPRLRVEAER